MLQFRISAISKEFIGEDLYKYNITLVKDQMKSEEYTIPEQVEKERDQILIFLIEKLNCKLQNIIWPDYIEIPEI